MLTPQPSRRLIKTIKEFGVRKARSAFCLRRVVYSILDKNILTTWASRRDFPQSFDWERHALRRWRLASKVGCRPAGRRTFQFSGRAMNSLIVLCKNLTLPNTGRLCLVTALSNCMVSTARRPAHLLRSRPSGLMCVYASKVSPGL